MNFRSLTTGSHSLTTLTNITSCPCIMDLPLSPRFGLCLAHAIPVCWCFDPACVLTTSLFNKACKWIPVTEYSALEGSSNYSDGHLPGMDTTRLLFALKQGPRSLDRDTASMTEVVASPARPHKMAVTTTGHVITAIPKSGQVTADLTESLNISADRPEPCHITAGYPE